MDNPQYYCPADDFYCPMCGSKISDAGLLHDEPDVQQLYCGQCRVITTVLLHNPKGITRVASLTEITNPLNGKCKHENDARFWSEEWMVIRANSIQCPECCNTPVLKVRK